MNLEIIELPLSERGDVNVGHIRREQEQERSPRRNAVQTRARERQAHERMAYIVHAVKRRLECHDGRLLLGHESGWEQQVRASGTRSAEMGSLPASSPSICAKTLSPLGVLHVTERP